MKTRKNNPFKVPKGYFDTLEEALLQKNQSESQCLRTSNSKRLFRSIRKGNSL